MHIRPDEDVCADAPPMRIEEWPALAADLDRELEFLREREAWAGVVREIARERSQWRTIAWLASALLLLAGVGRWIWR